jgi:putative ABC transport system permease protein
MLQDLRTAIRIIIKDRWFSAAAILALGLGIGVNATVFTLVNAVLIKGLPFPDSDRLFVVSTRPLKDNNGGNGNGGGISYRELQDWREVQKSFVGLAGATQTNMNISDDRGMPEPQRGARVTANLFSLLGQPPLLGRDFRADDERTGAEHVVILGNTVWKNRYGADPNVIGKAIRINGEPATIVGVMPPAIKFPTQAELWMQIVPDPANDKRNARDLFGVGRLQPGVTRGAALTELSGIAANLAKQYPDTNKDLGASIETFNERFNGGPIRIVFLALLGAVGFVLLIACANVANLQLSRAIERAREMAVRVALGATRWRIIRALLVESVLLGCLGGIVGLAIAMVGVTLFDRAVADVGKPYWINFSFDFMVFAYLAMICIATGIIFGLVPALQVSRTNVNDLLKEGGRGNAGSRRARWLSSTMVIIELALTIVLLVGAGLMVRSFMKLYSLDLGIPVDHLMTMRMSLPQVKYKTPAARLAFFEALEPKLTGLPAVESAAFTSNVPGFGAEWKRLDIEGRPIARLEDHPQISVATVSSGFFKTAGVSIIRGRALDEKDGGAGLENAVVNERFAATHFKGEDPIGRRIRWVVREGQPIPVWRTIVGIARNLPPSPQDVQNKQPAELVYIPYRGDPPSFAVMLVRSRIDPTAMLNTVKKEVQAIDPDQPVFSVQTLEQMMAQATWPYRVFGTLFAIFALIALVFSAVGLYAVMAYSVTQRTAEIGVRMALGAETSQISWLVMKRGLIQLAIGLSIGLVGAYFLTQVLQTLLVAGVTPRDPATFATIAIVLSIVAMLACVIPARRAARVDPLIALRD